MGLCTCFADCGRAFITYVVALLQIAACVVMVCIIALKLTDYSIQADGLKDITETHKCLLTTSADINNVCTYAYIVNGVSLGATVYIMLTACWLCSCWTFIGKWIDWLVAGAGTAWWVVAAIIFTKKTQAVDDQVDAQNKWRHTFVGLCWGMVLLFGILFIMTQIRVLYTVCACCCAAGEPSKQRKHQAAGRHDLEAAHATPPAPYQIPYHEQQQAHVAVRYPVVGAPARAKPMAG